MNNQTTIQTLESPFMQRHFVDSSAITTPFTASSSFGVFNDLPTAHDCFIGQHLQKTPPTCIIYTFSEMTVLNHSINVQFFNSNNLEFLSKNRTLLMEKISSLIKNFKATSRNLNLSPLPVHTSFFLLGEPRRNKN